jgi:hypothetical protein
MVVGSNVADNYAVNFNKSLAIQGIRALRLKSLEREISYKALTYRPRIISSGSF